MMKKFTFSAFALGLCLSGFAQEPVNSAAVAKIRAEGLDKSKAYDIAYQITDVAGPRLSNSPGLKRAQDWAVKYFNEMGLKNVHLEAWGDFGKGWQLKKSYIAMTAPYYKPIIAYPKTWTQSTKGLVKADVVVINIKDSTEFAQSSPLWLQID